MISKFIYRIRKETLKGGDFKYIAEMKKVYNNAKFQWLYELFYEWESVNGFRWLDDREKDCSYAKSVITLHKNNELKKINDVVVDIDFVDVNNCK